MDQRKIAVRLMTVEGDLQRFDPPSASRYQRNDRATETGGEGVDIDPHLLLFGDIQHVQRDDAGDPQLEQLQRQIEVALEVGGIDHVNQHVGVAAQDVVAGNLLVQRGLRGDGGQGVGSREVDQRDLVVSGGENPLFTLNGHPSPVAHALASAGQLIK